MDPFIGEIRLFGGTYAPMGWMFCDGTTLQIAQYDVLYSLLGTTYGGDGQQTFRLPDLRGRVAVQRASSSPLGASGGCEQVVLNASNLPAHTHPLPASTVDAAGGAPEKKVPASNAAKTMFVTDATGAVAMAAASISAAPGGSQPHDNMQPWLALNYIIACEGIYPTQS